MHKISKQIFKGHITIIILTSYFSLFFWFSFRTTVFMLILLSIFTFWYSIQYLGNINWEVLLLTKLGKLRLPQNF